ncbi:hypothetical protein [Chitinophaga sp. S165]|uniref:hypothetical protein n=1 Tax=Chitinophaga sp. S165 TaxID=2135462 RepID=UPI000D7151DC|nr:hypothetical protein [Chitinophaga sp. S165]PWV55650.1 hypothetical protein C7475_101156 [Chitinophaga sp. S165]
MQLKHPVILLVSSLLLSSCATVLTKKKYNFRIHYAQKDTKIRYNDSVYNQPASISVKRSRERLVFTAFNDSVSRKYEIRARLNPVFLWGDLGSSLLVYTAPIVYGVDLTNPKRFHYGTDLWVELNDTSTVAIQPSINGGLDESETGPNDPISRHFNTQLTHKGDLYWSVSWPLLLYNASYPGAGRKTAAGGAAVATGFEYYYRNRRALGIDAGISTTPVHWAEYEPVDYASFYPEEKFSSLYIDLYHKHTVKRFSFAYGLNYSYNTWKNTATSFELNPPDIVHERYTNHSFGVMASGYYQLHEYFKFGVVYRPTLLRVYPGVTPIYQHTISFDLAFTLRVKPKKE